MEAPTLSTSTSLLEQAKARDPDAWERLVCLYGPLVYRWIRRAGLQANDAQDVMQEVFSALPSALSNFRRDGPQDSFRGWLHRITHNKTVDCFRRLQAAPNAVGGTEAMLQLAQTPALVPDDSLCGAADGRLSVQRRALELIRADFEDRTWNAFWRVTVNGQAAAAVAQELGLTVAAVYQANYRVRRRFRDEFQDLLD